MIFGQKKFKKLRHNEVILLAAVVVHILLAIFIVFISNTSVDPILQKDYDAKQLFNSYVNITNVRRILKELSSIDSRAYPSQNNIEATNYLLGEIELIFQNNNQNTKSFFIPSVELFLSNGSATVNIIHRKTYMNYQMAPNIVVTLKPKHKILDHYCMISSHFDSVEGSPGASDNALFTSVVMEMIAHYSRYILHNNSITTGPNGMAINFNPHCNLLFVLNGAEESAMVAANAYITHHHLKDRISLLINLDSAGGDGVGYLFQTTNKASHLIKTYKQFVPYPMGNSLVEDIFRSGQIPADTDFQVYRDLGTLHGLDIAIVGNGHQYHNQYDAEYVISNVTLARETLNLCSLYTGIINDPSINDIHTNKTSYHGKYVYFDFLGKFMVVYPQYYAYIVNVMLVFLVIPLMLSDLRHITKGSNRGSFNIIFIYLMTHSLSLVVAVVCTLFFTYIMEITNNLLSYNTYYITALFLYGIPAEIVYVSTFFYLSNSTHVNYLPYGPNEKQIFIYWSFICADLFASVVGTLWFDLSSSYIHLFSLLSLLPLCLLRQSGFFTYINPTLFGLFYYTVYLSYTLIWTTYKIYLASLFFGSAFNFFDRTPCSLRTEYFVAFLVACITLSIFNSINSLIVPMKKANKMYVRILTVIWVFILVVVCFTPFSPPYAPLIAPKRMTVHHMIQSQFDKDMQLETKSAKMVIMATDHNCLQGYGKKVIKKLRPLSSVDRFWHCINAFTLIPEFKSSLFYYNTNIPKLNETIELPYYLNKTWVEKISSTVTRYYFILYCDQGTLVDIVLPKSLVIVNWSFIQPPVPNGKSSDGGDIYNQIFFVSDPSNPPHFWIDIGPVKTSLKTLTIPFNIIVMKHRYGNKNKLTPDIVILKEMLPKHVAPVTNVVERLDYVFDFVI